MSVKIKYFSLGTNISATFCPEAVNLAYHGYRCEAFMMPLYLGTEQNINSFLSPINTKKAPHAKDIFHCVLRYILRLN